MKNLLLLIFFVSICFESVSQENYARVDSIAASAKANSIESLHKELTKNLIKDKDKVRAFFYWMVENIKYDLVEWKRTNASSVNQSAEAVFKSRKGVCSGYSNLFKSLCDLSDIKCFNVVGYTKDGGIFSEEGHEWNVVFVNGEWNPIDVTWGAGYVNRNRYFKELESKYFLPEPKRFLLNHYPLDPAFQLVNEPVSLVNYKKNDWSYSPTTKSVIYNYNDTILNWMQNDSLIMEIESGKRMVRMNPRDLNAKELYSNALIEYAYRESKIGNDILSELFPKTYRKKDSDNVNTMSEREVISKLDEAYNYLFTSDSLFKKIEVTEQKNRIYINEIRKSLANNMAMIKSYRQSLE